MIVGRDAEERVLRKVCRAAAAGAGGAVLVEGIAGIGKSALLAAVAADAPGLTPLWGRAPEEGDAPAYWPWRELARAGGWAIDWSDNGDRFGLYAHVADVARAAAQLSPLLILLDDLHAADDGTIHLTNYVSRALYDSPVAMVLASRPDGRLDLLAGRCVVVDLGPLQDDAAEQVLDRHARVPLDVRTRTAIKAVAEGSPLVLRELALSSSATAIPRGVRVSVEQRLAPLDPTARTLVEQASVLGRRFDVGTLAALAGRSEADLLAQIDVAVRSGLIDGDGGGRWFSHQIVRDVVYSSLGPVQRMTIHRTIGELAERNGNVLEAARNLLAAVPVVDAATAVDAAVRAAELAASTGSWPDQVWLLERMLSLLGDDLRGRLDVMLRLGAAQLRAGKVVAATKTFDGALNAATELGDETLAAVALLGRTERVETIPSVRDHIPALGEAIAAADRRGDAATAVQLLVRRSALRNVIEQGDRAHEDAREAVQRARMLHAPALLAAALEAQHQCHWRPGSLEQAVVVSTELARVADEAGDADLQFAAAMATLVDALRGGDLAGADNAIERCASIAASTRSPRHEFFTISRQATLAFARGSLAAGSRLIGRALEIGQQIEEPDSVQVYWGAQFLVLAELHAPDDLLAVATELKEMDPDSAELGLVIANFRAAAGDAVEQARVVRSLIARSALEESSRGRDLSLVCLAAIIAVAADDAVLARSVLPFLQPFAGQYVVNAGGVTFCGLVDHWIAELTVVDGRGDEALLPLRAAHDQYRAIGATFLQHRIDRLLSRLQHSHASRTPELAGPLPALLRPIGEEWEVGFRGDPSRVPDSRGLHHLHRLLSSPHSEIHAVDLVSPGASALLTSQAREALLDETAKHAYRKRLADLEIEAERALLRGQPDRAAAAAAEREQLIEELRRAAGLGGRDRQLPNDAERARVAVRKAISASLTRLAEHEPALAAHLRTSIRTGSRCSYEPDPTATVTWTLQ